METLNFLIDGFFIIILLTLIATALYVIYQCLKHTGRINDNIFNKLLGKK